MYSSIKRKKCKCGCKKYPTLGCDGWSYSCAPKEIKLKYENEKQLQVRNRNARKNAQSKLRADIRGNSEDKRKLDLWYFARRYECPEYCECGCGQQTLVHTSHYKSSLDHLLEKRLFKSVMLHPVNILFLSWSCHADKTNLGYEHIKEHKLKLWEIIVKRFNIVYPFIAEEEKKYIPDILMNELKIDKTY